jgi:homoserine kinase type II
MAVYTEVSADEIFAFVAAYDIGEVISFKGIAEGVENSNYLLTTDRSPYILTLYEKRVNAADLPFFIGLMDHLSDKGIACPTPIHDRKGKALNELCGRPAAIISFLSGMSIRRSTPTHCGKLGRMLARMHLAAADFAMSRPNSLSLAGWRDLAAKCRDNADTVAPGLQSLIDAEVEFLSSHWPQNLPAGVIHADLFPDNVFFLGEELSGVIDFYFACNDFFAYDIAICINAWCFEAGGDFNATKARQMLAGYNAVRPLTPAEVDALPALCRGAALRFLLTRLYDWLNRVEGALVRPHDPKVFLHRLRFHQTVRSAEAYGLDMPKT